MNMNKYCCYDREENVIVINLTDLSLNSSIVESVISEVAEITTVLPTKLFAVVFWKDVKIPLDMQDCISSSMAQLLNYVRGLVRYETEELSPFRIIKGNSHSYVFASKPKSKAAALASVRLLEAEENQS